VNQVEQDAPACTSLVAKGFALRISLGAKSSQFHVLEPFASHHCRRRLWLYVWIQLVIDMIVGIPKFSRTLKLSGVEALRVRFPRGAAHHRRSSCI
jgi:hypothetical protein